MTKPFESLMAGWAQLTSKAPPFDEDASRARWIEAFSRGRAEAPPVRRKVWQYWYAAAAVLLLAIGGSWWELRGEPSSEVMPGAWLETRVDEQFPMHFGEGSEVVVHGHSRVHVASVDPRGASMVLERGAVSASIVHRADTRWAFAAGPFRVKVTGTKLAVQWDPKTQEFEVSVSSGSVSVTGPLLETGRTVSAGQQCRVAVREQHLEIARVDAERGARREVESGEQPSAVDVETLPVSEQAEDAPEPDAAPEPEPTVAPLQELPSWRRLEREGRYRDALEAAERAGLEKLLTQGSVRDLMSLARVARFAGRPRLATRALLQVRSKSPGSPEAATAAFLLGRAAAPEDAAKWFNSYLREQPAGLLVREASGRLIESLHRAGQFAAAQDAARRYLARYPSGPHAAFARSVLGTR